MWFLFISLFPVKWGPKTWLLPLWNTMYKPYTRHRLLMVTKFAMSQFWMTYGNFSTKYGVNPANTFWAPTVCPKVFFHWGLPKQAGETKAPVWSCGFVRGRGEGWRDKDLAGRPYCNFNMLVRVGSTEKGLHVPRLGSVMCLTGSLAKGLVPSSLPESVGGTCNKSSSESFWTTGGMSSTGIVGLIFSSHSRMLSQRVHSFCHPVFYHEVPSQCRPKVVSQSFGN